VSHLDEYARDHEIVPASSSRTLTSPTNDFAGFKSSYVISGVNDPRAFPGRTCSGVPAVSVLRYFAIFIPSEYVDLFFGLILGVKE
jgi:hypothetical protein